VGNAASNVIPAKAVANFNIRFNDQWSAAPSFTYFLKKDYTNWSALDLDVNYQLTELQNIGSLYAIGGLNMTFFKIDLDLDGFGGFGGFDDSVSGSDTGLNLGLGLKVAAGDKMNICPELKYTLGGANYLRIGVKVMFDL